jgi:hypothetical protein
MTAVCCENQSIDLMVDSQRICTNCGAVLSQYQLDNVLASTTDNGTGRGVVNFDKFNQKEYRVYRTLQETGHALKFPKRLIDAAMTKFVLVQKQKNFGYMAKGQAVALVCLYNVCREESLPVTISDLLEYSTTTVNELRTAFKKTKWIGKAPSEAELADAGKITPLTQSEAQVPSTQAQSDKIISNFRSFIAPVINAFDIPEVAPVVASCTSICKILRFTSHDEGLLRLPLALAVVHLALNSTRHELPNTEFDLVVENMGACRTTVLKNIRMIKKLLLDSAREMPFFEDLGKIMLDRYLPSVILHVEEALDRNANASAGSGDANSSINAPPSFTAARKQDELMKQKIMDAKERLKMKERGIMMDVETDEVDKMVEERVRDGCTEDEILNVNYKKQRYATVL